MLDMLDVDRILDKIKKCFALGKSSNEHEAATAMRQARALMDKYRLTLADVATSDIEEIVIPAGSKGRPPVWRNRLVAVCGNAFSCKVIGSPWRGSGYSYVFIGCDAAPELASYAYTVLDRQLQSARREYVSTLTRCKLSTKRSRGDAFAHAWIAKVEEKILDFAGATEEEVAAITAYRDKHFGALSSDERQAKSLNARNADAIAAGYAAGRKAQLNHGMTATQRAALEVQS